MSAYNIRKNWIASFGLIVKNPIVLLPFVFIAFFEGLALELLYFSPRKPLSYISGPIIKRFFAETYMFYPGNLVILPKLVYYAQLAIYIFVGVFLTGICVNIIKNLKAGFPLKRDILLKNGLKLYPSFFVFGVVAIGLIYLVKRLDRFIFFKLLGLTSGYLPQALQRLSPFVFTLFLFLSNIVLQAFLVLTIPLLVIKKRHLFSALGGSIKMGGRNFGSIFALIFLPFLVYLPITLLKVNVPQLMNKTFPEVSLYITIAGIVAAMFVECFVIVCATQFLLDKEDSQ